MPDIRRRHAYTGIEASKGSVHFLEARPVFSRGERERVLGREARDFMLEGDSLAFHDALVPSLRLGGGHEMSDLSSLS